MTSSLLHSFCKHATLTLVQEIFGQNFDNVMFNIKCTIRNTILIKSHAFYMYAPLLNCQPYFSTPEFFKRHSIIAQMYMKLSH